MIASFIPELNRGLHSHWILIIKNATFSITPDLLQHRDELSKFIGDEISRTLVEQKNLEKRYEELIEQRAAMKGMVNKIKYKEVQEEIQDVSRALRESTNNLVRSLKDNPNVSGTVLISLLNQITALIK